MTRVLKTLAPNMDPNRIHSDFERSEMNAWKTAFPRARVVGCIWHYAVAVSSFAHSLGLKFLAENNEDAFQVIMSLCAAPLLPRDLILDGVWELWHGVENTEWSNEVLPLFQYFEKEWTPCLEELSVWGSPSRTNNASESDNHTLANVLPQNRPNVFNLIGGFVKLEHLAWCDKVAIDGARQVTGTRKWKTIWNDDLVRRASRLLENEDITPGHFLHVSSYAIYAAVMLGLRLRRRDDDAE